MLVKVVIIGYAGADPTARLTPDGRAFAVLDVFATAGQHDLHTQRWKIACWDELATRAAAIAQSSLLYVEAVPRCDPMSGGPHIYSSNGVTAAMFEADAAALRVLGHGGPAEDGEA